MVGDIVLFKQDRDTWGISYTLLPEFRGRGLGRRAVELVLGWASRGMVVRKVEAVSDSTVCNLTLPDGGDAESCVREPDAQA